MVKIKLPEIKDCEHIWIVSQWKLDVGSAHQYSASRYICSKCGQPVSKDKIEKPNNEGVSSEAMLKYVT